MPRNNHCSVEDRSRNDNANAIAAAADCSVNSHRLRVPYRSTYGAHRNFNPQGRKSTPAALIWTSEYPDSRSTTGNAWVKNPKGTPCAKYKVPSSVRVPAVKEAGRNAFLMPAMVSEHHERRPSLIA